MSICFTWGSLHICPIECTKFHFTHGLPAGPKMGEDRNLPSTVTVHLHKVEIAPVSNGSATHDDAHAPSCSHIVDRRPRSDCRGQPSRLKDKRFPNVRVEHHKPFGYVPGAILTEHLEISDSGTEGVPPDTVRAYMHETEVLECFAAHVDVLPNFDESSIYSTFAGNPSVMPVLGLVDGFIFIPAR